MEWPFRTVKCQFDFQKVVYRSLKKNGDWLYALFASGNLYALAKVGRSLVKRCKGNPSPDGDLLTLGLVQ